MRIKKGDVRESLIEQLKEKGADVACFSDLIEDYMKLWSIKLITYGLSASKKYGMIKEKTRRGL